MAIDFSNLRESRVGKNIRIPTVVNENYIIFHHLGNKHLIIPVDPNNIADTMSASFAQNYPLSRSAPIYSYQHSGPRTVQFSFTVHRDLFRELNPDENDDVDGLINYMQAAVLPTYDSAEKMVNPPLVSVKIRDEIFIKGVVTGSVSLNFDPPIINYGTSSAPSMKYAVVNIGFSVSETTPYNASILPQYGQWRTDSIGRNKMV